MKKIAILLLALCLATGAFAQESADITYVPLLSGCATCLQLSGGVYTATGALRLPDGTAAAPSLAFAGTGVTEGIYRSGDGQLSFAVAGTQYMTLYSSQLSIFSNTLTLGGDAQVVLWYDAAGALALRNGTSAQAFRVYNTYTDASNYERGEIAWDTNQFNILVRSGGTGTARHIRFGTEGTGNVYLRSNGSDRWLLSGVGALLPNLNNAYDFGNTTNTVRSAYIATSIQGTLSKVLADAVATDFVTISVPVAGMVGGLIEYTITGTDATDFQSRSGVIPFAAVNKAGTETAAVGTVGTATEVVAVSAGTLTNTMAVSATAVANGFNLSANANSSLVAPTVTIQYRVIINSGTATVTGL